MHRQVALPSEQFLAQRSIDHPAPFPGRNQADQFLAHIILEGEVDLVHEDASSDYPFTITLLIDPDAVFKVIIIVQLIIMAVFGGTGTVVGPLLGALVLSAVSELLATQLVMLGELFNGFIIVLVVLFMPKGLSDLIRQRILPPVLRQEPPGVPDLAGKTFGGSTVRLFGSTRRQRNSRTLELPNSRTLLGVRWSSSRRGA